MAVFDPSPAFIYRFNPGDTAEHMIGTCRCVVYGIYPEVATTTGTITFRDTLAVSGGTADRIQPAGLSSAGMSFGSFGFECAQGFSLQLSAATDICSVLWAAYP